MADSCKWCIGLTMNTHQGVLITGTILKIFNLTKQKILNKKNKNNHF